MSLLLILALLKYGRLHRADVRPALAFALLTPSILAMAYFDRELVAFNMSGPFALSACSLFFSTVYIGREELERIYLALLGPIVGLATLATVSTLEADLTNLVVGGKATTGGIGPNQVSSMLGLGITVAVLSIYLWRDSSLRRLFTALALWLSVQGVLSLSRGGVWTAIGALAVAALYLIRTPRARRSFVLSVSAMVLIMQFVLFPLLNRSTGGLIGERFASTQMTGRDKIMEADLMAFRENPLVGVGPGGSKIYHARTFRVSSSHTEYTTNPGRARVSRVDGHSDLRVDLGRTLAATRGEAREGLRSGRCHLGLPLPLARLHAPSRTLLPVRSLDGPVRLRTKSLARLGATHLTGSTHDIVVRPGRPTARLAAVGDLSLNPRVLMVPRVEIRQRL